MEGSGKESKGEEREAAEEIENRTNVIVQFTGKKLIHTIIL